MHACMFIFYFFNNKIKLIYWCNDADEEKDDDIQIGFPTDVKHVAHIGWDGPAVDTPSWVYIISLSLSITTN